MSLQQKIAERMYELLPHKKELEFGCEYRALGQTFVQLNGLRSTEKEMPQGFYLFDMFENDGVVTEIIGQPIRLADILLAIEIHHKSCDFITISSSGFVVHHQKDICSYNLEKDNILDQSDEFCEFLLELLK